MTQLSDILDVDNLAKMVGEGMIAVKASGDGRFLYDYTASAQWSQTWNHETRTCRGLVATSDDTVIARPFAKFHNLAEHDNPDLPRIPAEPFEVFDKLDGSLIIAYPWKGGVAFNTRGSFASDQALAASKWLTDYMWDLIIPEGETWLFEWIASENRIVVDYGIRRELVLLAVIDNATGLDLPLPPDSTELTTAWPYSRTKRFDFASLDEIVHRQGSEGYVVRFESGLRVKMKADEYVRLHKLLTGVSAKTIWELLAAGNGLDELLDRVPDEFYQWVERITGELLGRYHEIAGDAYEQFCRIRHLTDRKAFALEAMKSEHRAILFAMYDGKSYAHLIWKQLKPQAVRPFVEEEV